MNKLRITNQREEIMNYLRSVKSHPTAEEVYEAVKTKLPRISLGTVYRNLNVLSEDGEIIKLELEKARFDADTSGQDHLVCNKCSKIIDIPSHKVQSSTYMNKYNFKIECIRTYFYGFCNECSKSSSNNGGWSK